MQNISKNILLEDLNTFHVPVKAKYYFPARNTEDLGMIRTILKREDIPVLIMGEGSNLLFTDDYKGLILHPVIETRKILHEDENEVAILAGSGLNWDEWVAWCLEKGYFGLENLSLIPGSVGAAPVQNIGAYGFEVGDAVVAVEGFDLSTGEELVADRETCHFSYRSSIFKEKLLDTFLITGVIFRLAKSPEINITYPQLAEAVEKIQNPSPHDIRRLVSGIRREKLPDPAEFGNAGSFFKNPVIESGVVKTLQSEFINMPVYPVSEEKVKIPAGWLIEQCGWKGRRKGNVGVWGKQALVIVNYGGASGREILDFSEEIRNDVKRIFGIDLEREVRVVGG